MKLILMDFQTKEVYRTIELDKELDSIDESAIFRLTEWEKLRKINEEISNDKRSSNS